MDTVGLSSLDCALMVFYVLFLIGMELYYRHFAQQSMENYYLGGRRMKSWMNGTIYAVTCMNADVAPAYCGMTVLRRNLYLLVVSEPLRSSTDDRRLALRDVLAAVEDPLPRRSFTSCVLAARRQR